MKQNRELSRMYQIQDLIAYYSGPDNFKKLFGDQLFHICAGICDLVLCKTCAQKHAEYLRWALESYRVDVEIREIDDDCIIEMINKCDTCGAMLQSRPEYKFDMFPIYNSEQWEISKNFIDQFLSLVQKYEIEMEKIHRKSKVVE